MSIRINERYTAELTCSKCGRSEVVDEPTDSFVHVARVAVYTAVLPKIGGGEYLGFHSRNDSPGRLFCEDCAAPLLKWVISVEECE